MKKAPWRRCPPVGQVVGAHPEAFYRRLHAAEWGPLCYTPDFLRGLASTLSVCSQNHEDGVLLSPSLGFAGFKSDADQWRNRTKVAEENNGAYLVHNHGFRGAEDPNIDNTRACSSHFKMSESGPGLGEASGGGKTATRTPADSRIPTDARRTRSGPPGAVHPTPGSAMDTVGTRLRETLDEVLGGRRDRDASRVLGESRDPLEHTSTSPYEFTCSIDMDGGHVHAGHLTLEAANPRVLVVGYQDPSVPCDRSPSRP